MKTIKLLLPIVALFVSAIAFGQKNNGNKLEPQAAKVYQSDKGKRERARVNGATHANEHANVNARQNANENSVLNGTAAKNKYKMNRRSTDVGRRKNFARKKN